MHDPDLRDTWNELRRRKVVRVALAYGAVVFAVLQLADLVLPALGVPDTVFRVLVVGSLVGFPPSLVLAWVFDVTPRGVRRSGGAAPGWLRAAAGLLAAAVTAGAVAWLVAQRDLLSPTSEPASVAVLPFVDMSSAGDQAYLGDGLAEEILNVLTRIPGLRVAARTSAFAFRGVEADIRDIGRSLDVATVLEGSIRKDGDRIRVTAQLIDVASGYHLWSETWDRKLTSVFAIQDSIARSIVQSLAGTLAPGAESAEVRVSPVTTAAAYEAYLRGRFHWNRRTSDDLRTAAEHFRTAVALDPGYAPAHAGLADTWALLPLVLPSIDAGAAWSMADSAAARALALDPGLAEARTSAALVRAFRYELEEADALLREALEANPSYATARHWRALVLSETGRHDEAVAEGRRARELDPLSPVINADLGYVLLWAGRIEEAVAQLRSTAELDRDLPAPWFGLALAHRLAGRPAEAAEALRAWARRAGRDADALAPVLERIRRDERGPVPPPVARRVEGPPGASAGSNAALFALLGDSERTLAWLDRSRRDRSYVDQYLRVNPLWDFVRDDPRFGRLLEGLGASE